MKEEPPEDPPLTPDPVTPEIELDPRIPPPPKPKPDNKKRNWIIAGGAGAAVLLFLLILLLTGGSKTASPATTSPSANGSGTLPSFYFGSPSPSASTSTSAASTAPTNPPAVSFVPGSSSDPVAVAQYLFPDSGVACGAGGNYGGCPLTQGAIAGINQYQSANPCCEPLCRCSENYQTPSYSNNPADLPSGYDPNQGYTAIDVRLQLPGGAQPYVHMIVLMQRQDDGTWIAFNTWCNSKSNLVTSSGASACTPSSS